MSVIKILFVCHGNICRSPMAEFVMKNLINSTECRHQYLIESAATSTEEIGNDIHYGTRRKLTEMHIPFERRCARRITPQDYDKYDFLIGMDDSNMRNMQRMLGPNVDNKISLLLSFAGQDREISDPWYTGNFDYTYDDILLGCRCLLELTEFMP